LTEFEVHSNGVSLLEVITSQGVTVDKKDIDRLLLESLDEVLTDVLSKKVKDAFYDHLERNYYFARDDISKRLGDFLLILERTFGKGGKTIERSIARRLCDKLDRQRNGSLTGEIVGRDG
jgi:hypothetical protein